MHGLAALGLAIVIAFAAVQPVPSLRLTDGRNQLIREVSEGEEIVYSYTSSVYEAPVEERHRRDGDLLRMLGARSTDIRAVEYFRWDGEPRELADWYEQSAPAIDSDALAIRVVPRYLQRIGTEAWTVDLAEHFGDGVVRVSAEHAPRLLVRLAELGR